MDMDIKSSIAEMSGQILLLSRDMTETRETMREIAKALNRLALAEERISQVNDALSRAFKQIDVVSEKLNKFDTNLGDRVYKLELAQPLAKQSQSWVANAVWACVVLVGVLLTRSIKLF